MSNSLLIEFEVKNQVTKEVAKINNDLNTLKTQINKTTSNLGLFNNSLLKIGVSAYALHKAYSSIIGAGLEYNKAIEQQTASIKTLLGATSQNVDSIGNVLSVQQKYNLANKEAINIMKELEKINANTPQTLDQTAQIYKTMLPSMRSVGASQKDLINITEKLAIASSAAGVEFNSLLAGVDGLATGSVLANSDLGRFLKSIGLTNKELKESDNVVELLTEKLSGFKALDTITVATSNLTVEWNKLTGAMTKDLFEAQKSSIKELTKLLKEIPKDDVTQLKIFMDNAAISLTEFAGASVRFVNGIRITFNQIEHYIDLSLNFITLGLDKIKLEYYEFLQDIEVAINTGFAKIGSDKRVSLVDQFDIVKVKDDMIMLQSEISDSNNKFNEMKSNGLDFNQKVIDATKIITDGLKKQNEQLEKQLKTTKDIKKTGSLVANKEVKPIKIPIEFESDEWIDELDTEINDIFNNIDILDDARATIDLSINGNDPVQALGDSYAELAKKMEETGLATNEDWEKLSQAYLKDYDKLNKTASIDIGSSVSDAIISGINGSNLDEIMGDLSSSIGNSMISAGVGSMVAKMDPTTALIGGIGLTALSGSSLFNSGTKVDSTYNQLEEIADNTNRTADLLKLTYSLSKSSKTFSGLGDLDISYGISDYVIKGDKRENIYGAGGYDLKVVNAGSNTQIKEATEEYFRQFFDKFSDDSIAVFQSSIDKSAKKWYGSASYWRDSFFKVETLQDAYFDVFAKLYDNFSENGIDKLASEVANVQNLSDELSNYLSDDIRLNNYNESVEIAKSQLESIDGVIYDSLEDFANSFNLDVVMDSVATTGQSIEFITGVYQEYYNALSILDDYNQAIEDERNELQDTYDLLTGVTSQRELELEQIDETNRDLQLLIWAEEDRLDAINAQTVALNDWNSLLDEINNQSLNDMNESLSDLNTIISSSSNAINTLGESLDSSYNLDQFYTSFNEAISLEGQDGFSTAVADASTYASALTDSSYFTSAKEQTFAQATALNQFKEWETTAISDSDRLDTEIELINSTNEILLSIEDILIGESEAQAIYSNDLITAIKTDDFIIEINQSVSDALYDVFDGTYDLIGTDLDGWISSNQDILDINNDGILEAVKSVDSLGESIIQLDSDGDGVMDVSIITDESGIVTGLDTIATAIVGDSEAQITYNNDLITAISSQDYIINLGEDVSDSLYDVFGDTYDLVESDLSDWLSSNQDVLDINNDYIVDAIKGINDIGENFVDIDTNGDGILDIRIMQDESGIVTGLETIATATLNTITMPDGSLFTWEDDGTYNTVELRDDGSLVRSTDDGIFIDTPQGDSPDPWLVAPTNTSTDYDSDYYNTPEYWDWFNSIDTGSSWGYVPFADGGIVTSPTRALIGEAGYSEAVIPLKDPNDPLSMGAVVKAIEDLKSELRELKIRSLAIGEKQLQTQRGLLSEQLN